MTGTIIENATVQKLIDELQMMPRDAKVYIVHSNGFDYDRYNDIMIDLCLQDDGSVTIE